MPNLKIVVSIFILLILSFPLTNRDIFLLFGKDYFLPVRMVDLLFGAYGVFVIFKLIRRGEWKKSLRNLKEDPFFILLSLLWLVRLISIVNSKNIGASFNLLTFYTFMMILYLFFKFLMNKSVSWGFKLYQIYLGVIGLTAVYALSQLILFLIFRIKLPGLLVGGNYFRVPATFYDANHLPAFLVTGAFFLLVLGFSLKNNWAKGAAITLSLLTCLSIFLSFSRSGLLAFGVGFILLILFIVLYKLWRKFIPLTILIVLLFLALLISDRLNISLVGRIFSSIDPAEKSTTAHALLIGGEFDLFSKNPILGVGYGGFSEAFRQSEIGKQHLAIDPSPKIRLPAHSVWLEVLTETGILGFSLFTGLFFLVGAALKKGFEKALNKRQKLYLAALTSSLVGLLVGGIFYSYNLEFFWFFIFFVYLFASRIDKLEEKDYLHSLEKRETLNWGEIIPPLVLGLYSALIIFWDLGKNSLIDWDEAIYAQISKIMILRENYLEPYWNGLWFEKPPLYMWLTVLIMKLEEFNNFAPRFWSAFFGVGGVVFTYLVSRLMYDRLTALFSGLVLASSFHYLYYSRNGMLDVSVTFFMILTIFFILLAKRYPLLLSLAGVSLGLAVMTKGVVAFLILPALATLFLFYPKELKIFSFHTLLMVVGFLLTALPWHLLMYLKHGQKFLDSYLGYHVVGRATTNLEGKSAETWVYLKVIRNSLRIWTLPLIFSLIYSLKKVFNKDKNILFLLIWTCSIFFVFTVSTSKLIWYIIPIYPPLAILTGRFVAVLSYKLKEITKFTKLPALVFGILALFSIFYTLKKWDMVQPKDFNGDVVKLIKAEDKDDYKNNNQTKLTVVDFGTPVSWYYISGPNEVIERSQFSSVLGKLEDFYLIAYKEDITKYQKELDKWDRYKTVEESGERVLIRVYLDPVARWDKMVRGGK